MSKTTSFLPEKSLKLDKVKNNISKELKRIVSLETLLQFKEQDLTMSRQEATCAKYYHGQGNIICQIDRFVGGNVKSSNFWIVEDNIHGPLRIIPHTLHRLRRQVFAADNNVTSLLLS
jgi:hypothetical protein